MSATLICVLLSTNGKWTSIVSFYVILSRSTWHGNDISSVVESLEMSVLCPVPLSTLPVALKLSCTLDLLILTTLTVSQCHCLCFITGRWFVSCGSLLSANELSAPSLRLTVFHWNSTVLSRVSLDQRNRQTAE